MSRVLLVGLQKTVNRHPMECVSGLYNYHNFIPKLSRQLTLWQSSLQQKIYGDNTSTPNHSSTTAKEKKIKMSPKITLIGQNQSLSVMSLEEAQKLAKRRDMHLVQTTQVNSKTQRPTYKIVTAAEMLSEQLNEIQPEAKENSMQTKSEKMLTIGARINEHDLASRLKNIAKWLSKNHEVRILIQGTSSDMSSCEKIFKTIESSIQVSEGVGKIVQKRSKGNVIKFSIVPVQSRTISANTNTVVNTSA